MAHKFLTEGYHVWGTAREAVRLEQFGDVPNFHAVELDLDDAAAAVGAYQGARKAAAGGFDVVVNNAGYGVFDAFDVVPFEVWDKQIQAMLVTTLRLIRAQVIDFKSKGAGAVVNVASLATEFPLPYMSGYNVAKAGLSAMSESLLIELESTPIRVIDFRPGDFRTDFNVAMNRVSPALSDPAMSRRMAGAWATLQANLDQAPEVGLAAYDLFEAVEKNRRGVVRSGSFFQTRLAPLFERLVPQSWARAVRWHYFGLR